MNKILEVCKQFFYSHRESVWSFLTGKLPENTPASVLHGIRELEMWMLRLLSAPVPVPGKTRVEVSWIISEILYM